MNFRSIITAAAGLIFAGSALGASLPNYDAVAEARVSLNAAASKVNPLGAATVSRVQWDDRFGVPSFVWAGTSSPTTFAAARVAESNQGAAREYVASFAPLYALDSADVANAYVSGTHDTGRGAVVVKFKQRIGTVEVFRDELNVVMDGNRELVAIAGHISAVPFAGRLISNGVSASGFLLTPASAIAGSFSDATAGEDAIDVSELRLRGNVEGGYQLYERPDGRTVRVKQVYFHLPGRYEPGYYVEVTIAEEGGADSMYGYVVSAIDGRLLFRNNFTADQTAPTPFSYRVWAGADDRLPFSGPQGYDGTPNPNAVNDGFQPQFVTPNLLTLPHGSISTSDPWLAANATETSGNNVDAYADVSQPDGFSNGDLRATTTGPLLFDRVYDVRKGSASSAAQQMASVTQLFYDNNFFHDWFYDAGFNEAAGNAQKNNYGRGGLGNDELRVEAQDYSGRNNANMQTPPDGVPPRMQMYVWDSAGNRNLRVETPSAIANAYATGSAIFGPDNFDISGDVVRVSPLDGCQPFANDVRGKIVFIDRGNCNFVVKVLNAKAAGALATIIGNVASSASADSILTMGCPATCTSQELAGLPSLQIAFRDATSFRSQLDNGIRVMMRREPNVDRDGTIDNQIVAHEWGHYLSGRLIGNGNGLTSTQARGMGEGWSDFVSLLLTVRPADTRFPSNTTFNGAYAVAVYVTTGGANGPLLNKGAYFGIRRVPYSTDVMKDPLTLRHFTNGAAVTGAEISYGGSGASNAEVHNAGEVWGTMLWEAYASLLRDTLGPTPRLSFADAQQRMKEYLVASLRITPTDPTVIEARDALLAAAFARDKVDYQRFWTAFAKRGAGITAVGADRYSVSNAGTREDFNAGGAFVFVSFTMDDNVSSCVRNGALDSGETGTMRISLRNTGSVRLEATTATMTSSDPALTFANGARAPVPASEPGETVVAMIDASLASGVTTIVKPDIAVTITDPQILVSGGIRGRYEARLNIEDAPKQSSRDDFESLTPVWSASAGGASQWKRIEISPREHRWFAPEPDKVSDTSLISPEVMVGPTGNFIVTFRHRFAFDYYTEFGVMSFIDGGVIELTADDGQTWVDIGNKIELGSLAYGFGTILSGNGSAIQGRRAFQAVSPSFNYELPSSSPFAKTTMNLGTAYAGKRVRVRFRSVTGAEHSFSPRLGWEIDDVEFTNITNLPFAEVLADRGVCGVAASTTALATSASLAKAGQPVTLTATVTSTGVVTGSVDFFDNGRILATARVQGGVAQFVTSSLPQGDHSITATFNGAKNFTASTSSAIGLKVAGGKWGAAH